jgi:hypothetical protein
VTPPPKRTSAGAARQRMKAARSQVPLTEDERPDTTEPDGRQHLTSVPAQDGQGAPERAPEGGASANVADDFDHRPASPPGAPLEPYAPPAQQAQTQVAQPTPFPVQDLPAASAATRVPDAQRGTGIDVPPDLHERVQREARSRSRGGKKVTQTEILLNAFEAVFPRLPQIVARHQARQQTSSSLFGTRAVHAADQLGAMKRLQIRPTYHELDRLYALADHYGLKLSVLTRIVLIAYFHPSPDADEP